MLLALTVCLGYTPDDGTQGYTPYFYKMDVPVRVRSSISYGRAWQMLRSRGAGSNETGNCDPPQLASSCNCSGTTSHASPNIGLADRDDIDLMPRCRASSLCDGKYPADGAAAAAATATTTATTTTTATILLVMDTVKENMRFPVGNCDKCLRNGYRKLVREVIRCLLALRAVGTTLPIHLLVSGFRYAEVEALLAQRYGVKVLDAEKLGTPPNKVPTWASKWARGSFAKLRALTLTQFQRVVLFDNDNIVLRNIDHLGSPTAVEAPAFVYGWKCYPRRELRASTMVLTPSLADWARAQAIMADESAGVYDDLGEQSVWRRLYLGAAAGASGGVGGGVYELPAGYAAMRTADLPAAEWPKVHIVHDAHLIHDVQRVGWHAATMLPKVDDVDKQATKDLNQHFLPIFSKLEPPTNKGKAKRRGGSKRAAARRAARRAV